MFEHRRRTVVQERASARQERGETLIETVVSVLLIGTVVVALITTLFTVVKATDTNRKIVRTGNEAVAVAEAIERTPYQACGASPAPLGYYRGKLAVSLDGFEADIIDVRYLKDRAAVTPPPGGSFQVGCPVEDQGTQEITVELRSKNAPVVKESLVFYKRSDLCPVQNKEFEGQLC